MSRLLSPFRERSPFMTGFAQPVIVAMGVGGLTGGAMVAAGLLAGRVLRRH